MDIQELQKHWHEFGQEDPLWGVLSADDKKGNKWSLEDFFKTGVDEVGNLMRYARGLGIPINSGSALDFGSGVGRLTQPLCEYFQSVKGVDIAPSMVKAAQKLNMHGTKCKYYLNERSDLKIFPDNSFDFVYSNITLQHMERHFALQYIREFLRTLKHGGLLIFQLPTHPKYTTLKGAVIAILPQRLFRSLLRAKHHGKPVMEMYGTSRSEVLKLVNKCGGRVVAIQNDNAAGRHWNSLRYTVTKDG